MPPQDKAEYTPEELKQLADEWHSQGATAQQISENLDKLLADPRVTVKQTTPGLGDATRAFFRDNKGAANAARYATQAIPAVTGVGSGMLAAAIPATLPWAGVIGTAGAAAGAYGEKAANEALGLEEPSSPIEKVVHAGEVGTTFGLGGELLTSPVAAVRGGARALGNVMEKVGHRAGWLAPGAVLAAGTGHGEMAALTGAAALTAPWLQQWGRSLQAFANSPENQEFAAKAMARLQGEGPKTQQAILRELNNVATTAEQKAFIRTTSSRIATEMTQQGEKAAATAAQEAAAAKAAKAATEAQSAEEAKARFDGMESKGETATRTFKDPKTGLAVRERFAAPSDSEDDILNQEVGGRRIRDVKDPTTREALINMVRGGGPSAVKPVQTPPVPPPVTVNPSTLGDIAPGAENVRPIDVRGPFARFAPARTPVPEVPAAVVRPKPATVPVMASDPADALPANAVQYVKRMHGVDAVEGQSIASLPADAREGVQRHFGEGGAAAETAPPEPTPAPVARPVTPATVTPPATAVSPASGVVKTDPSELRDMLIKSLEAQKGKLNSAFEEAKDPLKNVNPERTSPISIEVVKKPTKGSTLTAGDVERGTAEGIEGLKVGGSLSDYPDAQERLLTLRKSAGVRNWATNAKPITEAEAESLTASTGQSVRPGTAPLDLLTPDGEPVLTALRALRVKPKE